MYALTGQARRILAWMVVLAFVLCLGSLYGISGASLLGMDVAVAEYLDSMFPVIGLIAFLMYLMATIVCLLKESSHDDDDAHKPAS
jgi:hypothetical protein